ncbi:quercetin 2,3-dioxygenase [Burkholderia ubonensis]|uniref:pirin family protein n=1 Tax=Burkholderia ubonensis TaxID=101571 RepID=UPI00075ADCA1|nr:pirin family protein [Burkholderia ubonensis]AOI71164.1 quercetin 2,3-dioxygenase [Burkholderia ubonensis]KUZ20529.1 quercetin 2,3-dioxygenase [Burkholderia ubonensis]KUZ27013.1 quercetin 2,3-dioxygenase [Burkholderia ubonensis]KUZ32440.1 quercetin 2,3-dioxygenase [Burkholderia ubonensis]KUZ48391.1 quercetin 2,3-dioxygenase [Burkholderia ubonensis]
MFQIRRAADRGHFDHGWLVSRHSFPIDGAGDDAHPPFGALRVLNDDRIAPTRGFGMHPHRDMEIVTYVLEGALAHRDSMGNGSIIRPGDVQRMSAGTGIVHSEYNASRDRPLHLLQIWLLPTERGGRPGYDERRFGEDEKRGRLRLIASPDGRDGSVSMRADARIHAGLFDGGEAAVYDVPVARRVYVHVARGALEVNGEPLESGDGVRIGGVASVALASGRDAEVLLFDLA